ncbi:hypothetical protein BcepSauron_230 [Burkholderia phage BcepSauron]|uniref:Uncharacterized protein n=2 Tax=Sarumanvirus TaxID=2843450 RepID=A0A482MND0_9CAUD|nr:putative o-spanin [Burkholderia phage BcepSaruman]YP_009904608.1 hypothetical protein H1O17_gp230 [Burkholderia phage BcepSauron]QBQ74610.1 hypothetical protein BcepSauron_230 [Burkholderia phage BcepSauron]QBX06640.1 putative o-spanin [Burkholderia phage BcepSaruman]
MRLTKTAVCAILTAAVLSGCGTAPTPSTPVLVSEKQSLNIDPKSLDCDGLSKLDPSKPYGEKEQVKAIEVWANEFDTCRLKFRGFVTLVTPLLRINQPAASK